MARNVYRKGNPLTVAIVLTKPDGTAFNLAGYSCRLYYSTGSRWSEASGTTVSGNVLSWVFAANKQEHIGDYRLKLLLYQNGGLFCAMNFSQAFELYSSQRGAVNEQVHEQQVSNIVTLHAVAEYYLLKPVIPAIGSDGYWYVDGLHVIDDGGSWVSAEHTLRYDETTHNLIIDEGRVDKNGNSIQQTITDIADALADFQESYNESEGSAAESEAGDGSRWGAYKSAEAARESAYSDAEDARDAARTTAEGTSSSTAGDGSRWGAYKTAEAARGSAYSDAETARNTARATAEGSSSSTAGDGSRWGAYKTAEAARNSSYNDAEAVRDSAAVTAEGERDTAYNNAESARDNAYEAAEADRNTAEGERHDAEVIRQEKESERQGAESEREERASSDHDRAESDHETASSDHETASGDHGQAVDDHNASVEAAAAANTAATGVQAAINSSFAELLDENYPRNNVLMEEYYPTL